MSTDFNFNSDTSHFLATLESFPRQCKQAMWEMAQTDIPSQYHLSANIVVSGMGGSALGGRVIASLERQVIRVPIVVSTEYHLPNFVDHKTLLIISSYSGNTEETIMSAAEGRARNANIFIITTGGKLAQIANNHHLPSYIFDPKHNPSSQPRMALGYSVTAIASLLSRCQLIHPFKKLGELPDYLINKQENRHQYQKLAEKLAGKIPVFVTSEHLKGSVHCFKNQVNENSKHFSVAFDLPELNHHLMEGLTFPKTNQDNLYFIFIRSAHFHSELQKRYEITETVLKKQNIKSTTINMNGPDRFFETMETIQMGGFVSFYLSKLNNVDPGPIPWVDFFKDSLLAHKK